MTLLSALTYHLQRLWLAGLSSARLCVCCDPTEEPESLFDTENRKNVNKYRKQGCPAVSFDIT